jgi:hypothetical protein
VDSETTGYSNNITAAVFAIAMELHNIAKALNKMADAYAKDAAAQR